ncbi:MAG: ArnT family glycosyltransferase [Methylococcaceae bacterium]
MYEKLPKFINNHLIAMFTGVFILRVAYLFVNDLDLIGDETYYWDWSRVPDWCYYSKPPMVAWLIALVTEIGGDYTAAVRLPTVVLGTVFLGYFYATARAFYSSQAAAFALLLMLAMPFNILANLVMTIDPPLYCFWMMSLYYLRRALFDGQQSAWFWAGVSTGAALLSKQVALFIPLMLIVFLLLNRQRHGLFKREFLIYLLPVIVCSLPILIWNQQHDWVMLGHSKGHFGIKESITLLTRVEQGASFLLYQLLLVTPVIAVLVVSLSVKASARLTRLPEQEQFLVLMGPVLLLGIIVLGFLQKVQGNWPMPFYFSALILLSGQWLAGNWKKPLKTGLLIGYLMVSLTYALPLLIQAFNLHNSPIDPTFRFRNTQDLVDSIDSERQKILADPERAFVLVVGHRYLVSQLAFYLPDHPKVYRYDDNGLVVSQYEVWSGPIDKIGKTAFIVTEKEEADVPVALKSVFLTFRKVGEVVNPMKKNAHYNLFLGESLKFWPPSDKQ